MQKEIAIPEAVGMSSKRLERIRPAMQGYVDQGKIAGLSTLIARKGRVVHFEQVGQMDVASKRAMADDAIFRIYSMTKPIVCTALMTLYEQGKFQLADPVARFIPAFDNLTVLEQTENGEGREVDLARPVSIRDLMTHTSGLTYHFLEDSPVGALYRQESNLHRAELTLEEFVDDLTRFPLAYQSGSRWHYSVGIDVVARLVELLSGQSLGQYLQETLFEPLGMADTGFCVPPGEQHRIATMYGLPDIISPTTTFNRLFNAWTQGVNDCIDVSATYPAASPGVFERGGFGLFSTAWDYMRFAQMLLNQGELEGRRVLGRKTIELMHMNTLPVDLLPYKVADPPAYGYGFGLGSRVLMDVAASGKPGSVGEFGWGGAAKTYYWVDPQEEMVGIFMAQSMMCFDVPDVDFHVLAYQAVVD